MSRLERMIRVSRRPLRGIRFGISENFSYLLATVRVLVAVAGTLYGVSATAARSETMQFELVRSPSECMDCRVILASGIIGEGTPTAFEEFLARTAPGSAKTRTVILLDSEGGDMAAGLSLGAIFRRGGFEAEMPGPPWTEGAERDAVCLSACAYAFLGAPYRSFGRDDYLAFHQFSAESLVDPGDVGSMTGAELLRDQYVAGVLVNYIVDMGIAAQLYELAAATPPDQLRYITRAEAAGLQLLTDPGAMSAWSLEPIDGGLMARSSEINGTGSVIVYCKDDEPETFRLQFFRPSDWNVVWTGVDGFDAEFESRFFGSFSVLVDGEPIIATSAELSIAPFGLHRSLERLPSGGIMIRRDELHRVLSGKSISMDASDPSLPEHIQALSGVRSLPGNPEPGLAALLLRHCK